MKGPVVAVIAAVVVVVFLAYVIGFLGILFKQTEQTLFTVDFTPTAVSIGDSTATYDFNSTVSGGIAPYDYFWDFDDGALSSGSDVQHTFVGAGTYSVKLLVIDSMGISRSATKTVTVVDQTPLSG